MLPLQLAAAAAACVLLVQQMEELLSEHHLVAGVTLHTVTVATLLPRLLAASLNLTLSLSLSLFTFLDIKFVINYEDLSSSVMTIQYVNDFSIPFSPLSRED